VSRKKKATVTVAVTSTPEDDAVCVLGMEASKRLLTLLPKTLLPFPGDTDFVAYVSEHCVIVPSGIAGVVGIASTIPGLQAVLRDPTRHSSRNGGVYLLEDIQAWEDAETQEAVLEARDTILSEYNQAHGRDPTTAQHRTAPVSTATTATVKDVALLRLSDLPVDDAADDARLQLGLSWPAWRFAYGRVLVGVAVNRFMSQDFMFNTGETFIVNKYTVESLMMANAIERRIKASCREANYRILLIRGALAAVSRDTVEHNKLLLELWDTPEEDLHQLQVLLGIDDDEDEEDDDDDDDDGGGGERGLMETGLVRMPDFTKPAATYTRILEGITPEYVEKRKRTIPTMSRNLSHADKIVKAACAIQMPDAVEAEVGTERRAEAEEVYTAMTNTLRRALSHIQQAKQGVTKFRTELASNVDALVKESRRLKATASAHVKFLTLFATAGSGGSGMADVAKAAAVLHPTLVTTTTTTTAASPGGPKTVMTFRGGHELPDAVIKSLEELDIGESAARERIKCLTKTHRRRWKIHAKDIRELEDTYMPGTAWSSITMIAAQALGSVSSSAPNPCTMLGTITAVGREVMDAAEVAFADKNLKTGPLVAYDTRVKAKNRRDGEGNGSFINEIDISSRFTIDSETPGQPPVFTEFSIIFPIPSFEEKKKRTTKKRRRPSGAGAGAGAGAGSGPGALSVNTYVSIKCPIQVCNPSTVAVAKWVMGRLLQRCGFWAPGPESTLAVRKTEPPPIHAYTITTTTTTLTLPQQIDRGAVRQALTSGYGGARVTATELLTGIASGAKKTIGRAGFFKAKVNSFKSGEGCMVYISTASRVYNVFVNIFKGSLNALGNSGSQINAAAMFILCAWIARAATVAPELNLTTAAFNPDLWRASSFRMDPVTMYASTAEIGTVVPEVAAAAPFMHGALTPQKATATDDAEEDRKNGITRLEIAIPVSARDVFRRVNERFDVR